MDYSHMPITNGLLHLIVAFALTFVSLFYFIFDLLGQRSTGLFWTGLKSFCGWFI